MTEHELQFLLRELTTSQDYDGQIVGRLEFEEHEALFVPLPPAVETDLVEDLSDKGIRELYAFQRACYDGASDGYNVTVVSPTASGKSLAFQLPVLNHLLQHPGATALFLYPTKALIENQLAKLKDMERCMRRIKTAVYDGDTDPDARRQLRKYGRLLLSNPDSLHYSILPYHESWSRFLRGLAFVVVDEGHYYHGVLGSHMALVLRRLRRLANFYGAHPVFIVASATIDEPSSFSSKLTGELVRPIDPAGAPEGRRTLLLFNPKVVDKENNIRKSVMRETLWLFQRAVQEDVRTIVFTKSRQEAELLYKYVRDAGSGKGQRLGDRVATYRAGYLPAVRRGIEHRLASGELTGVVATNALELGIDIGHLDVSITAGYPGSITSLFQQMGRAGRERDHSLSIFVASSNPLDQYVVQTPAFLSSRHFGTPSINPDNEHILSAHLRCAAYELPLRQAVDTEYFGPLYAPIVERLTDEGKLKTRGSLVVSAETYPHRFVNLRTLSDKRYHIVNGTDGQVIEEADAYKVIEEFYPGAIFLHQGDSYLVVDNDHKQQVVHATPTTQNYYTDAIIRSDVTVQEELQHRDCGDVGLSFGKVVVSEQTVGFIKKSFHIETEVGREYIDTPEISYDTMALWVTVPDPILENLKNGGYDIAGSLHAAEHLLIALMPIVVLCDPRDLGGISTILHRDTLKPSIFVYDGHIGGVGLTETAYSHFRRVVQLALDRVTGCPCKDGCPSCVYSPKCGNNNKPLDKYGAQALLTDLLERFIQSGGEWNDRQRCNQNPAGRVSAGN
jgi:DEAD/DEAH box helicase domain-containing protein